MSDEELKAKIEADIALMELARTRLQVAMELDDIEELKRVVLSAYQICTNMAHGEVMAEIYDRLEQMR